MEIYVDTYIYMYLFILHTCMYAYVFVCVYYLLKV